MSKFFFKLSGIVISVTIVFSLLAIPAGAAKPTVRILCFAQGFAWPELFGTS